MRKHNNYRNQKAIMEQKLRALKLKKVTLVSQMTMLSSISDHFYTQLGKLEVEIIQLERKIIQESKNPLSDES